jgi:hypothetical protein
MGAPEPAHNADLVPGLVEKLADALEAENVRCKISLWQHDESGYGFGPLGDPCPINLTHLAEFCVGVLRAELNDGEEA